MKKFLMVAVVAVTTVFALAQGGDAGKKSSSAKGMAKGAAGDATAVITKLERDWEAAMNKKDDAAAGKILSDAWIAVNPDGSTEDKAKYLSEVKAGEYQSVKLESVNVRTFGNTAVATGKGNDPRAGNVIYMDVFTRQGGSWKAVATQVAKIQ